MFHNLREGHLGGPSQSVETMLFTRSKGKLEGFRLAESYVVEEESNGK